MSELNLRFSGLCGFVPKLPLDNVNNQARVLLPDVRTHSHHAHVPVLLVQDGLFATDPTCRQPDGDFVVALTKYHYFELDDEDITIIGAQPDHLRISTGGGTGCPVSSTSSFEWVVPIGLVTSGSGDVQPECLQPASHPSVVTRIALTEGRLERSIFAVEPPNDILLWEFKPAAGGTPSGHQQAMAEEVRYLYDYATDHGDLQTRVRNGGASRTIRLLPVMTMQGPKLFAAIYNLPWANIRRTVVYTPPRRPDTHFDHFYAMSTAPGARNIPWPLRSCGPQSGPSVDTPLCPPTRFNPNAGA